MSEFISQDDLEAVRELLQVVASSGLDEISVTLETGASFRIATHAAVNPVAAPVIISSIPAAAGTAPPFTHVNPASLPPQSEAAPLKPAEPAANRIPLQSPMVGIYYGSPSPGEPPFVVPGDRIQVGQTIGLIEAMKVFSEIPSDVAGRVVEIVVSSSDLVQLGQPLLYVEPV